MPPEAWMAISIVALVVIVLAFTRFAADVVLTGALTLLMVVPIPTDDGWRMGILTIDQALAGLSNPAMVTVAVLFVVVTGMRDTGGLQWVVHRILGRPNSIAIAQARVIGPVLILSAFLNNTPVVAMMIPAIHEWARKLKLSVSKFMIPLSYAAILGGLCTLIGTSTNLVVNGLITETLGKEHALAMFDIAWVGLPCAVAGVIYLLIFSRWLLPERQSAAAAMSNPREYTVEMLVEPDGPLVGKNIEQAGLRHLPGMYLMEIERHGDLITAVGPDETLRNNDRLVFVGVVDSVVDLQKIRGLIPATEQVFKLQGQRSRRTLIEAVVSNTCPMVGQSIRDGRFRSTYGAVVIAVARNGERLNQKIGDIVLRAGDTLLLEAMPAFAAQQRNSRDFYLVSELSDSAPPRHEKAIVAVIILAGMVITAAMGWLSMLVAALLAGGLMIFTRCCSTSAARRSVDWSVLIVIAAAFGLGRALDVTGAANAIAHQLINLAGEHPWLVLAAIYLLTALFTELITNNAAAVLMFPIALATATDLNVQPMPFVITIMIAASASFATPLGYQTNLMVYGPGGYRYTDYLRIGLPLNAIMATITITLVPHIWPF